MEILSLLGTGFGVVFQPTNLFLVLLGTTLGTLFGALPGLATIAIDNSYPHSRTSIKKKRPGDQPEINYHELHIKPIFSMKACRVNLHEGIGDLLDEVSDEDYHDHYKMPGQ